VGKEPERKKWSSSSERQCRVSGRKHGEPHDWLQDEIGLQGEVCKIDVYKRHFGGVCGPRETDWDRSELRRRSGLRLGTEPAGDGDDADHARQNCRGREKRRGQHVGAVGMATPYQRGERRDDHLWSTHPESPNPSRTCNFEEGDGRAQLMPIEGLRCGPAISERRERATVGSSVTMRVVAKRTSGKRTHFENPMRGSRDQSATTRSSIARARLNWGDDEKTRPHATRSSEQPRRRRDRSIFNHFGGGRTAENGGCEEGTSTILEETTKTTVVKHRTPANTGRSGKGSTSRAKQPETVGKVEEVNGRRPTSPDPRHC